MPGIYRVCTISKHRKIGVEWVCSKCGAKNIGVGVIDASASFSDKGAWSQNELAKRERFAQKNLVLSLEKKYDAALEDAQNHKYRKVILDGCRCRSCGHAEPWIIRDSNLLVSLRNITLVIAVIASVALFHGFDATNWEKLSLYLTPFAVCQLTLWAIRLFVQSKIRALQEESCAKLVDLRDSFDYQNASFKKTIFISGYTSETPSAGSPFEEVELVKCGNVYYYFTHFSTGFTKAKDNHGAVPQSCIIGETIDEEQLLKYIANKETYMKQLVLKYGNSE